MIKTRFTYEAPETVEDAVALLAEEGGATIVGGGTWVVPEMTNGKRTPARIVDLRRARLAGIRSENGSTVIGATTTYRDLIDSREVAERLPMLRTLALGITGGAQIWNQGTVGGSACYATPASDVPAALVALGARLLAHSASGVREVPAHEFFAGPFETSLAPDEVLAGIVVGRVEASGYYKFKLCESSWPIVTAAYVRDDAGERVALGAAQATPVLVELDGSDPADVAARAHAAIDDPWSDVLAPGSFRKSIAGVVAKRAAAAAREESA